MKAMLLESFGGKPDFRPAVVEKPEVKPGHVLIRVRATSVNPVDIKIRKLKPVFAPALPAILGMDVAGVIEECGLGVADFIPGDEVFGCAGGLGDMPGALAEYMLADARLIAKKPAALTMEQAAALPLVTITAWEALFDRARIQPGQHVLIHAGAGGVGHVAVQLAKAHGTKVAATVSSRAKADIALSLGADEVINYREEPVDAYVKRLTGVRGFDAVFDTVGGRTLDDSFAACVLKGAVVSTNTRSTHDLSNMHAKGLTLSVVFMLLPLITGRGRERHGEILTLASVLASQGKLRPLMDRTFALEEIAAAHDYLDGGKATGKVTVRVG